MFILISRKSNTHVKCVMIMPNDIVSGANDVKGETVTCGGGALGSPYSNIIRTDYNNSVITSIVIGMLNAV
jgi:hypothetical protein